MARRRSPRPQTPLADLDGARAVVRVLVDARAAEVRARVQREDYIEREYARGVRPIDIANRLQQAADEMPHLDEATRRGLGVREGSVHHALARRGAKG